MNNILKPTEEQKTIFYYIDKRKENIVIKALAGSGKSSTIVAALKLLPKDKSTIFLAFNKHMQEDLKTKLPENIRCMTMHGLGLSAIKRVYGSEVKIDEFKIDKILKSKSKKWKLEEELLNYFDRKIYLSSIKKLVDLCRMTLTLDAKYIPYLIEKHDISVSNIEKTVSRTLSVLEESMNNKKVIDFTDMIFFPAIDNKIWFFQNDYVFIDECQDINRAQQRIIEKVIKRDRKTKKLIGRLIGVGDSFQNIYGFSGVDQKTFDWFLKFPNTKILPLTHSFRCGVNIINEARKIVSDIKPRENAHEGIVRQGNVLSESKEGDFVLCRTTAPLIVLFFELLGLGKKCSIKGSDIGVSLIEMVDEHKTIDDVMSYWRIQLDNLQANLISTGILDYSTHSGYVSLNDKYMALMFLSQIAKDVDDLKHIILTIFREDVNGIILSTVHKAKGLEADRVFIIRPDLLPMKVFKPWQAEQEKNLHYVAITRAKNELIYDYNWTDAKKLEEK